MPFGPRIVTGVDHTEFPLLWLEEENSLDIEGIGAIMPTSFRDRSPIGPGLFLGALVLLGVYAVEN
jgi:hypothetical protein